MTFLSNESTDSNKNTNGWSRDYNTLRTLGSIIGADNGSILDKETSTGDLHRNRKDIKSITYADAISGF